MVAFSEGDAFNDAFTSFFHKSTGGYHAAKLRRYQDIIEFYLSKEARQVNNLETCKVMNMMNTKYIIYDPNKAPIQNPFAYGNAWFVDNIKQVSTNDEEILAIKETDLKKTAIVHQEFSDLLNGKTFGGDSTASIQLETKGYRPDHLTYNFNSSKNELVVFSEVYYDQGWNAYIDGEKVDYLRANYVLRALYVPAGKHILEFKFEPTKINTYNQINVASSLLIMLLLAGSIYLYFKPKKNTKLSDLDE